MHDKTSLARLIKCLQLTASEIDGEALAAIRRANAILSKTGSTWADLLQGDVSPSYVEHPSTDMRVGRAQAMLDMLAQVSIQSASTLSFLNGLRRYLETRGQLTEKQMEALNATYKRYCRRSA